MMIPPLSCSTTSSSYDNSGAEIDFEDEFEYRFNILETELRCLYQNAPFGLHTLDSEGRFLSINDKELSWLGYAEDEVLGKIKFVDLLTDESEKRYIQHLAETESSGVDKDVELELISKNNSIVSFVLYSKAHLNSHGTLNQQRSVLFNNDLQKSIEARLNVAEIVFDIHDCIIITDADCNVLRVNKAFNKVTGYSAKEAIGKTPQFLSIDQLDPRFYKNMWSCIDEHALWEGEIWDKRKNGEVFPAQLKITAVKDKRNVVVNYVASLVDISESKAKAKEIEYLAFYDPLTELPNRRFLIERLKNVIASSSANDKNYAVMFLDLDHFKTLNDSFGHNIGDLLLKGVASNIKKILHDTDTFARIGGDEFIIILESLSGNKAAALVEVNAIAEKVLASLARGYVLDSYNYVCTGSLGVTFFSGSETNEEELLKQADLAMYQAKSYGRNSLCFFDPKMQENISNRALIEHDLRIAIQQNEFQLYYQTQVNNSGKPVGAEALIRWIKPNGEVVSPVIFIPIAEDTGLILAIGKWVINEACAQLSKWSQREATRHLPISINVSALEFKQAGFAEHVKSAIAHYHINPSRLSLELTESTLLENVDNIIAKINELTNQGIKFELDDFGTGYSSLQYLKKLPVSRLKIDQTFVRDINTDESDVKLVHAIINLAHGFDMKVIAEGVETQSQLKFLQNSGCDYYQGYYFGKPMPIDDFELALDSAIAPK